MALVEKAFGDIITFTRSSGGGRINALGEYEWLAANEPRLTHAPVTLQPLGLLVEEQRTNLLLHTANFADAAWQKINTTAVTAGVSLQGLPVNTVADNATLESHSITQLAAASVASGTAVTVSIFVKAGSLGHAFLGIGGTSTSANPPFISVNLATGAVAVVGGAVLLSGAVPVGDGWWRVSLVSQVLATGSAVIDARLSRDGVWANRAYAGDGSNVLFTGAQLELGASATSYIPTAASQVTRAADMCSVNTLSPWYNPLEGTLVVEGIPAAGFAGYRNVITMGTSSADQMYISMNASGFTVAGVSSVAPSIAGVPAKINSAVSYKSGTPVMYARNGVLSVAPTNLPGATNFNVLAIGRASTYPGDRFNGIISSITYYPRVIDVQQASA